MTTQAQHTGTAGKQTRRADAGVLQITQRDINGFVLCAEHQGVPYDLLASALRTSESAVKLLVYRWRRAGYVATARLGPGPWWCWLTKEGMSATGLRYPTGRPPLSRLEHIRAVLAARLWLSSGPVWQQGQAWWQSERRLRGWPPVRDWQGGWERVTGPGVARSFLLLVPLAVPAGLGKASVLWVWWRYAVTSGIRGWLASAAATFDARQWRRQVRTARGRIAAPGAVLLLASGGRIPAGGTIRSIGHRWRPVFAVPFPACARHMVVVGATGSGKTNLMMRLWAGWFTGAADAAAAGRGGRPLHGAGARRVAIWPDEAQVPRPKPSLLTLAAGLPGGGGTSGPGQAGVRLPAPRREQNPAAESATARLDHVTGPGAGP